MRPCRASRSSWWRSCSADGVEQHNGFSFSATRTSSGDGEEQQESVSSMEKPGVQHAPPTGDTTMKQVIRAVGAGMLALGMLGLASTGVARADEKVTLGVAIPTADHGFTGGIVWWANKAKADLEKAHPDLKVIVKTAANAPEQANQLKDLVT